MKKCSKKINENDLKIVRAPNEDNEAFMKIKALRTELKERERLWIDTIVITTIHGNRTSKDN